MRTLEPYAWSSWPVYGGREPAPGWLDTRFVQRGNGGRSRKEWLAAVREYTEAPIRQGRLENPWEGMIGGVVLGEVACAKGLLAKVKADPEEQPGARARARVASE